MGIVADAVNQVIQFSPQDIEPAPAFGTSVRLEYLEGMAKLGTKFVLILNMDHVFAAERLAAVVSTGGAVVPARRRLTETVRSSSSPMRAACRRSLRRRRCSGRSATRCSTTYPRPHLHREAGIALTEGKKSLLVSRVCRPAARARPAVVRGSTSASSRTRASTDERRPAARPHLHQRDAFLPRPAPVPVPRRHPVSAHRGARPSAAATGACARGAPRAPPARSRTRSPWRCSHRFPPASGWQVEIVGAPISRTRCSPRRGRRCGRSTRPDDIPLHYRKAFMLRGTGSQAGKMKAGPEIRDVVAFTRMNLNDAGLSRQRGRSISSSAGTC